MNHDMPERSPSTIIQDMVALKLRITSQSDILKSLEKDFAELSAEALSTLQTLGLQSVANGKATVTLSNKTVGTVKDWDEFYNHIRNHGAFELLERRVSQTAWREANEETSIPGVEPYTMTQVKLTIKR